jgi:hypothetical protein
MQPIRVRAFMCQMMRETSREAGGPVWRRRERPAQSAPTGVITPTRGQHLAGVHGPAVSHANSRHTCPAGRQRRTDQLEAGASRCWAAATPPWTAAARSSPGHGAGGVQLCREEPNRPCSRRTSICVNRQLVAIEDEHQGHVTGVRRVETRCGGEGDVGVFQPAAAMIGPGMRTHRAAPARPSLDGPFRIACAAAITLRMVTRRLAFVEPGAFAGAGEKIREKGEERGERREKNAAASRSSRTPSRSCATRHLLFCVTAECLKQ